MKKLVCVAASSFLIALTAMPFAKADTKTVTKQYVTTASATSGASTREAADGLGAGGATFAPDAEGYAALRVEVTDDRAPHGNVVFEVCFVTPGAYAQRDCSQTIVRVCGTSVSFSELGIEVDPTKTIWFNPAVPYPEFPNGIGVPQVCDGAATTGTVSVTYG